MHHRIVTQHFAEGGRVNVITAFWAVPKFLGGE
jgi:hypothetical protein